MVTSSQQPPVRDANNAIQHPARCMHCDQLTPGPVDTDGTSFCNSCGWSKVHTKGPRESQCGSCFNKVNVSGAIRCAALMYQMPDGTWRDRYNQAQKTTYREGGVYKDIKPVTPTLMRAPQYNCDCYEKIGAAETRESIRLEDPLRFYSKSRFW